MHSDGFPARLYVVLARQSPRAVILRRGPSKLVRAILWRTDDDTFACGQWLRGRVYAERCDLAPDGSLFLYFATQHHKASADYTDSWTAISKPPYFSALALWPLGHTWTGGGVFVDRRTVYVDHCGDPAPHPDHQPPRSLRVVHCLDDLSAHDRARVFERRLRGWQQVYQPEQQRSAFGRRVDDPPVWHLPHPRDDAWFLVRRNYGYIPGAYPGPALLEYALGDRHGIETPIERVTWAGWDQRGRLVYARDGQLFAHPAAELGTFVRPLADFNEQAFEEVSAPAWARRW